jgi:hypothetical protein
MLREKLVALPNPAQLKDPLDVFPPEIVVMIFGEFDFVSLMYVRMNSIPDISEN